VLRASYLILTDSGGVQEEAPSLGKPVLILRETTERQEAVDAGAARLIGTDESAIVREVERLLSEPDHYNAMARVRNPFGDGRASARIVQALRRHGTSLQTTSAFQPNAQPEFQ
jgi:UDP-N-acetylglucosamine 2-epimerase (non-hydrolysing)